MQGESRSMGTEQILRYLYLVDRRLTLLTSGINWKPEYEAELEAIDRELKQLREVVEAEHKKKRHAAG